MIKAIFSTILLTVFSLIFTVNTEALTPQNMPPNHFLNNNQNTEKIASQRKTSKEREEAKRIKEGPEQVLIFVSSSMPRESLIQWFNQARQGGAVIVLRGWVDHSLSRTIEWLTSLIEKGNSVDVDINPVAFEAYHVTKVPAVVVTTKPLRCFSDQDCRVSSFDIVYGNTSLSNALKAIATQKGETQAIAELMLARISNHACGQ